MERRRALLDEARVVSSAARCRADSAIEELRALRVEVEPSAEVTADLRRALDDAGVALGDDDLDRGDLVLVAEAWLDEAGAAARRASEALRADLDRLREERAGALAALEARAVRGRPPWTDARREERRTERLAAARARCAAPPRSVIAPTSRPSRRWPTLVEELAAAARERADRRRGGRRRPMRRWPPRPQREAERMRRPRPRRGRSGGRRCRRRPTSPTRLRASEDRPTEDARGADGRARAGRGPCTRRPSSGRWRRRACSRAWWPSATAAKQDLTLLQDDAPIEVDPPRRGGRVVPAGPAGGSAVGLPRRLAAAAARRCPGGAQPEDIEHVLGRLERMAEAVQVIVVSDDPVTAAWAARGRSGSGRRRAPAGRQHRSEATA